VRILLQDLPKLPGQQTFRVEAIHPGTEQRVPLAATDEGGLLTLDVPLRRGCAMVTLSHTWVMPARRYFTTPIRVEMGTVINNAEVRYTLDGQEPSLGSALHSEPLPIQERTLVRMAVFVQGVQVGDVLNADYVQVQASPP